MTVDGPREPRSKIRHQGFHPFAFGGQRFGPDPLMGGLSFKLSGMIFMTYLQFKAYLLSGRWFIFVIFLWGWSIKGWALA